MRDPIQNPTTMVAEKIGSIVFYPEILFSTHCDPKHLENTLKTLLNQFMATKKLKNRQKTRNSPGIKILPELGYVVLGVFKVKKPKHKPPHHMKPFDIKINRFGGQNLPQRSLSLSKLESGYQNVLS